MIEECAVDVNREDPKGHTPFMVAVDWGNMDVVRYFLKERKISEAEGGVDHVFRLQSSLPRTGSAY